MIPGYELELEEGDEFGLNSVSAIVHFRGIVR
jgi:hypothetical protein